MKILNSLLAVLLSFTTGWLGHTLYERARTERLTEERDLALAMTKSALAMSQKALNHSLSNAETLEVCLTKIGLRPIKQPATRTTFQSSIDLAQLEP